MQMVADLQNKWLERPSDIIWQHCWYLISPVLAILCGILWNVVSLESYHNKIVVATALIDWYWPIWLLPLKTNKIHIIIQINSFANRQGLLPLQQEHPPKPPPRISIQPSLCSKDQIYIRSSLASIESCQTEAFDCIISSRLQSGALTPDECRLLQQ